MNNKFMLNPAPILIYKYKLYQKALCIVLYYLCIDAYSTHRTYPCKNSQVTIETKKYFSQLENYRQYSLSVTELLKPLKCLIAPFCVCIVLLMIIFPDLADFLVN